MPVGVSMKHKESMTYRSTIIIMKEGKWYIARSLELGVTSQGKTIEEAKQNLKEAINLYLEDQPKNKKSLPSNTPFVTSIEINK